MKQNPTKKRNDTMEKVIEVHWKLENARGIRAMHFGRTGEVPAELNRNVKSLEKKLEKLQAKFTALDLAVNGQK